MEEHHKLDQVLADNKPDEHGSVRFGFTTTDGKTIWFHAKPNELPAVLSVLSNLYQSAHRKMTDKPRH
jgi:hypothetical protein